MNRQNFLGGGGLSCRPWQEVINKTQYISIRPTELSARHQFSGSQNEHNTSLELIITCPRCHLPTGRNVILITPMDITVHTLSPYPSERKVKPFGRSEFVCCCPSRIPRCPPGVRDSDTKRSRPSGWGSSTFTAKGRQICTPNFRKSEILHPPPSPHLKSFRGGYSKCAFRKYRYVPLRKPQSRRTVYKHKK